MQKALQVKDEKLMLLKETNILLKKRYALLKENLAFLKKRYALQKQLKQIYNDAKQTGARLFRNYAASTQKRNVMIKKIEYLYQMFIEQKLADLEEELVDLEEEFFDLVDEFFDLEEELDDLAQEITATEQLFADINVDQIKNELELQMKNGTKDCHPKCE